MIRFFRQVHRFSLLSENQFKKIAAQELERLTSVAESSEQKDLDVSSTDNMLRIKRKQHTIVVNTQTPNRQLWYSSTISGPQRYNYEPPHWINSQKQHLATVLQKDLEELLKL